MSSLILIISAVLALLVPLITSLRFKKKINWRIALDSPNWDFRSWASTFSVAGTAISYSAISSAFSTPPTFQIMTKQQYVALGALAAALAILAPVIFKVASAVLRGFKRKEEAAISFLIGASVTVLAVTLQLLIGACLLWEMKMANILSAYFVGPFVVVVLVLCFSILPYGVLTARDILRRQHKHKTEQVLSLMETPVNQPQSWSLL